MYPIHYMYVSTNFVCILLGCSMFSSPPCPSLCDRHFRNTMPCCLVSSSPVYVSILCVSSTCSIGVQKIRQEKKLEAIFSLSVLYQRILLLILLSPNVPRLTIHLLADLQVRFHIENSTDDSEQSTTSSASFFSIFPLENSMEIAKLFPQKDKYILEQLSIHL